MTRELVNTILLALGAALYCGYLWLREPGPHYLWFHEPAPLDFGIDRRLAKLERQGKDARFGLKILGTEMEGVLDGLARPSCSCKVRWRRERGR